jgi:hypothetical protein
VTDDDQAYFQRNFPKLAPFIPRLFADPQMTLLSLSKLSADEMIRLLSTPSPDETKRSKNTTAINVPKDGMALNQAKVQVPSALQRLRRFVDQKNSEYEKMMAKGGTVAATQLSGSTRRIQSGSAGSSGKKAGIVKGLLDGTRSESVETGLVAKFDGKRGVWVEEILPNN